MTKLFQFILILILINSCSLNTNSKFWTNSEKIDKDENLEFQEVFPKEGSLNKEFNSKLSLKFTSKTKDNSNINNFYNNDGRLNFSGNLKKKSTFKFSKIENFNQYQPEISFHKDAIIFFDNKGSIFKFDNNSKLVWKKNYYNKSEKKLNPILQLVNNGKNLIITDNLAKYYMLEIETGNLVWSKNNLAPFNSQIKIYKDKFFVIDLSNTLRCFSLKNGQELWNVKTQNSLIRTQKKLSMTIIKNNIYFINSLGDISAVDINTGEMIWQLPTQSSLLYESSFSLKNSDLVSDGKSLFFSNNKNQFFSIDIETGSFNWENKINSNLRATIIGDYIVSISIEGYLIILEKKTGRIIRATDTFKHLKKKKREQIKPVGFIVGLNEIYLSTSNGRLMIVDVQTGRTKSSLKIGSEKISKPFIQNDNLFLIRNNAIIKLN